jgi:tyrosine-protein kinase Fer
LGYAVFVDVLLINVCELLQAWKNMLEELENTAKLIKQNADSVESKSLDKLNSLYVEKRRARKQYQEEHNRIVAQFTHVSSYFILLLIIYSRCLQSM